MAVNVEGVFHCLQRAVPHFERQEGAELAIDRAGLERAVEQAREVRRRKEDELSSLREQLAAIPQGKQHREERAALGRELRGKKADEEYLAALRLLTDPLRELRGKKADEEYLAALRLLT